MKVKTHLAGITGVCAVLALALPVRAADMGWYFNADAGANWAQDANLKINGASAGDLETDVGFRFGVGVGYNLNRNWGVEFDTGYVWNSIKDSGDSSFSHIPFIINAVYRFPFGAKWETYIGGGVGGVYSVLTADESSGGVRLDDDDGDIVFGWQAIAGVRYLLSETMSVGVGYKYMGTTEGEYDIGGLGKVKIEGVHNHSFGAVFSWKF